MIGGQRTRKTFGETIKGLIAAGRPTYRPIAARPAEVSKGKKGPRRVIRVATADELWLIADSSDLRMPYAEAMPYLLQVRNLDQQLVPSYHTLNVIGLAAG